MNPFSWGPLVRRALRLLGPMLLLGLLLNPADALERAPAWTLQSASGQTVRYPDDAQGQPTVLLFWPSWCPYSRALQPYVQDIWEDYQHAGVKLWSINIMETGDPVRAMQERGLSFPLLLNGDALINPYGITRTPWFLVIDGRGHIVYTRPPTASSPIEVAKAAREALNRLLGSRAVPLPTQFPPPYDLHLRQPGPSRTAQDAAPNEEWLPWAEQYLAQLSETEPVAGLAPLGAVPDGKTALRVARELWSRLYGIEITRSQAPYRAFRRNDRWLVVGSAFSGQLGRGLILVMTASRGEVLQLRAGRALGAVPDADEAATTPTPQGRVLKLRKVTE